MFMIISGVVGAFLYVWDSSITKFLGIICFYLWFIFDCSDGEVARYTKRFSKYGRELDYMAHLICHPLVILVIWATYKQMNFSYMNLVSIICISFVAIELVNRSLVVFDTYLMKENDNKNEVSMSLLKYILIQFLYFPNFVLLFPLLLFLDYILGFPSFIIYFCWFVFYTFYHVLGVIKRVLFFYHS